LMEEAQKWIRINDTLDCAYAEGVGFLFVQPPMFVELIITQTDPGVKGDTAQGGTKPATLETGAAIMVPLFVEEGTKVKIDTRTGEYLGRVS
jgi:elongation factor P